MIQLFLSEPFDDPFRSRLIIALERFPQSDDEHAAVTDAYKHGRSFAVLYANFESILTVRNAVSAMDFPRDMNVHYEGFMWSFTIPDSSFDEFMGLMH